MVETNSPTLAILGGRLRELGHQIAHYDDLDAECFVSLQHHRDIFNRSLANQHITRRILVSFEPRIVSPEEYRPSVTHRYDSVIRWSALHKTNESEKVFTYGGFWAGDLDRNLLKYSRASRNGNSIGLINANKHSFITGSLYTLRSQVIRRLANALPEVEVNVAGAKWQAGSAFETNQQARSLLQAFLFRQRIDLSLVKAPIKQLPNIKFHGEVSSTLDFLSTNRFALVIENEASYVSEKLFNAILAGCVPIYFGPPIEEFGIDPAAVVSGGPSPNDFVSALKSMQNADLSQVIQAGQDWIRQESTRQTYSYESSMARLAELISQEL
jgi:hypothetical protein